MVVEDDLHVCFEALGVLAAGLVSLLQEADGYTQPRTGLCAFDELSGDLHRVKDHALAGSRDVRKHPVFDRIVL